MTVIRNDLKDYILKKKKWHLDKEVLVKNVERSQNIKTSLIFQYNFLKLKKKTTKQTNWEIDNKKEKFLNTINAVNLTEIFAIS